MRSKSRILTTLLGACGALALEQQHDRTHHPVSTATSSFERLPVETWVANPTDVSLAARDASAVGAAATSSGDVTTPIALSRVSATTQGILLATVSSLGVSDVLGTVQSGPTSLLGSPVASVQTYETQVGSIVQTTESPMASPVQTAASQLATPVGLVATSAVGSVVSGPVSIADQTSQAPVNTAPSSPAPQGVSNAADITSIAPTKEANAQTAITSVIAPISSDVPSQSAAPAGAQDTSLVAGATTLIAEVTSQMAPSPSTAAVQIPISTGNAASQTSYAAQTAGSPVPSTPQISSGANTSPTQDRQLAAATVLSQSTATSEPQKQPDSSSPSTQFSSSVQVSAVSSATNAASDSKSVSSQVQTQNAESVISSVASASQISATQPSSRAPALTTSSALKKADKIIASTSTSTSSSNLTPSSTSDGTLASATSSPSNTATSGASSITTAASLHTESESSTGTGGSSQTDSNGAAASQTSTLTLTSSTSTTKLAEHLLAGSSTSTYPSGTIIPSATTTPSNGTVASIANTPLSKAVNIGAIVGPVVGAVSIIFALLGLCLWRRRRRQRRWAEYLHKRAEASEDLQEPESRWRRSNIALARDVEADGNEIYEADPDAEIHELDGEGCLAQVHRFFRELFELEGDARHPTELEAIEDPQEMEGDEPSCMTAVQQWFQRLFGEKREQDFVEIDNIDCLDEPRPSEKRRRRSREKRPVVEVSSPTDTSPDDDARSIDFIEELERNRKKMGARAERQRLGEGDDDDAGSIARSAMTGMTQLTEDRIDPLPRYTP